MNGTFRLCTTVAAALALAAGARAAERTLRGTWCLAEEELVLTFVGKDSVRVTSTVDDGVNGTGRYAKQDTMFVATIQGDSLQVVMGYRYEWKSDSVIEARTLFVTVNGDSVNVTAEPISMRRCKAPAATQSAPAGPAKADAEQKKRSDRKR
jgi:hypothetical protein